MLNHAISPEVLAEWAPVTITNCRQLPEVFGPVIYPVPGDLFTARGLTAESYQYRPNDPVAGTPKYAMPAGVPVELSLLPSQRAKIGRVKTGVVQEGTLQHAAVASWAPMDVIVVGMAGCYGYSRDGVVNPELYEILAGVERVVVSLDADVATNAKVWKAAKMLEKALRARLGPKVKIDFLDLPAGAKAGADDYLASIPTKDRASTLANLIESAGKLPRKPRETRTATMVYEAAKSDFAKCEIRDVARVDHDGKVQQGALLAAFGAQITKVTTLVDKLAPDADGEPKLLGTSVDIQVSWMNGDERNEATIKGVGFPKGLDRVSTWMARLPGGVAPSIWHDDRPNQVKSIVGAIKTAGYATCVRETATTTLGWNFELEGEALYFQGSGAIGEPGLNLAYRADLDPPFNLVRFADPAAMTAEAVRADAVESLGLPDLLVGPTPIILFEGAFMYALTGADARTMPGFGGAKGSGKSTVVNMLMTAAGDAFYKTPMMSAESTAKSIGEMAAPCHNFIGALDDILKEGQGLAARRAFERDTAILVSTSRRAYGGGAQGGGRLKHTPEALRDYTYEMPVASNVMLMIIAEEWPEAKDATSTIDRLIPCTMTYASTWKPNQARVGKRIALGGSRARRTSKLIQWLAAQINETGSLDLWVAKMEDERSDVEEALFERFPQLETARSRETIAPIICGYTMLMEYNVAVGALTKAEAEVKVEQAYELMGAIAVHHFVAETSTAAPVESTLDALRAAVASGQAVLGSGGDARVPSIGKFFVEKATGDQYLALIPKYADRFAHRNVAKSLASISYHNTDGRLTRNVNKLWCVVIPADAWAKAEDRDTAAWGSLKMSDLVDDVAAAMEAGK